MQNGYGGIHILTVFPVLYRSFSHFSEQTPVLLDAELGFVPQKGESVMQRFITDERTGIQYRRYFLHLRLQRRILRQSFQGATEAVSVKILSPGTVLPDR